MLAGDFCADVLKEKHLSKSLFCVSSETTALDEIL